MIDADHLRGLLAYNQWADERVLAAVEGLGADELERSRDAYFGSIAANLWHTLNAQQRWLARWRGADVPSMERVAVPSWPAAYAASHAALRGYTAALTSADFQRVVTYGLRSGATGQQPLGQLVVHLVNHGTLHRAEAGLLLERIGRSPGDLDYILYLTQRSS
jgi:uncharacterized damage-inducible protein DinB